MKALKEIGLLAILRFIFYTFWYIVFCHACFPPLRVFLLRLVGAGIGENVVIHHISLFNLYRRGPSGLTIGDNCFLGDEAMLDLAGEIILGNDVTLSNRVTILTHTNVGYRDHPLQKYIKKKTGRVVFKKGTFVGVNATILPNVIINEQGAVAAGAVVDRNVDKKTLVGGVPAKLIKRWQQA